MSADGANTKHDINFERSNDYTIADMPPLSRTQARTLSKKPSWFGSMRHIAHRGALQTRTAFAALRGAKDALQDGQPGTSTSDKVEEARKDPGQAKTTSGPLLTNSLWFTVHDDRSSTVTPESCDPNLRSLTKQELQRAPETTQDFGRNQPMRQRIIRGIRSLTTLPRMRKTSHQKRKTPRNEHAAMSLLAIASAIPLPSSPIDIPQLAPITSSEFSSLNFESQYVANVPQSNNVETWSGTSTYVPSHSPASSRSASLPIKSRSSSSTSADIPKLDSLAFGTNLLFDVESGLNTAGRQSENVEQTPQLSWGRISPIPSPDAIPEARTNARDPVEEQQRRQQDRPALRTDWRERQTVPTYPCVVSIAHRPHSRTQPLSRKNARRGRGKPRMLESSNQPWDTTNIQRPDPTRVAVRSAATQLDSRVLVPIKRENQPMSTRLRLHNSTAANEFCHASAASCGQVDTATAGGRSKTSNAGAVKHHANADMDHSNEATHVRWRDAQVEALPVCDCCKPRRTGSWSQWSFSSGRESLDRL